MPRPRGWRSQPRAGNCATGPNERCEAEDQFEIPAGHPAVVAVAAIATDDDGAEIRAWYSTRQPYVELAAPGDLQLIDLAGEIVEKSGTSYATPFVSATIALLVGADGPLNAYPDRVDIARDLLAGSALDLAPDGPDPEFGHGQLQIRAALAAAIDYAAENPAPPPPESDAEADFAAD